MPLAGIRSTIILPQTYDIPARQNGLTIVLTVLMKGTSVLIGVHPWLIFPKQEVTSIRPARANVLTIIPTVLMGGD